MKNSTNKTLLAAISFIFMAFMSSATLAETNPFGMSASPANTVKLAEGMKCGAGKCGNSMKKKEAKKAKCGDSMKKKDMKDGKCGDSMKKKAMKDGKCGATHMKEKSGKCGSSMKKKEMKSGKCGSGKCTGNK